MTEEEVFKYLIKHKAPVEILKDFVETTYHIKLKFSFKVFNTKNDIQCFNELDGITVSVEPTSPDEYDIFVKKGSKLVAYSVKNLIPFIRKHKVNNLYNDHK